MRFPEAKQKKNTEKQIKTQARKRNTSTSKEPISGKSRRDARFSCGAISIIVNERWLCGFAFGLDNG